MKCVTFNDSGSQKVQELIEAIVYNCECQDDETLVWGETFAVKQNPLGT